MDKQTITTAIFAWIKAARPHTMGLSIAVILAGSSHIGLSDLRLDVLFLAILSAAGLQLLSNFANDYGDFSKGTDAHRAEDYRALSAGNFTVKQVKQSIVGLAIFSAICFSLLILFSPIAFIGKCFMFGVEIAAILAAIMYTLGKRAYGYWALGDMMVFLFFGLVGVAGCYYLQGGDLANLSVWLSATAFGALSTSVLNINNIRDREKDLEHKKFTVANLLSVSQSLSYQKFLFIIASLAFVISAIVTKSWLTGTVTLFVFFNLWQLNKTLVNCDIQADYNHCLAATVKSTLRIALLIMMANLAIN